MSSREHLNLPWFNAVRILYGYARQNIGVVLVVGFAIFCIVISVLFPMHIFVRTSMDKTGFMLQC